MAIKLEIIVDAKQLERARFKIWKIAADAFVGFGKAVYSAQYKQLKESGLISPCRYQ